jgi:hypothetical protein
MSFGRYRSVDRERPRLLLQLGDRKEWVPDRPGVNCAADEGGGSVGRREIYRYYGAPGKLDAFEGGDQQVVSARRLGDRDLLAR